MSYIKVKKLYGEVIEFASKCDYHRFHYFIFLRNVLQSFNQILKKHR